jgi:hypothetical protein
LTEKDKKKELKRKRVDHKQQAIKNRKQAMQIALERRESLTSEIVSKSLDKYGKGYLNKRSFHDKMKRTFEAPLSQIVEVPIDGENDDETVKYNVQLSGFNSCAYSDATSGIIAKMTSNGNNQSAHPKKKKRKKRLISTKKGAPSWAISIGMAHNTGVETQQEQGKLSTKERKSLEALNKTIREIEEIVSSREKYWEIGGEGFSQPRKTLATMFGVKQTCTGRGVAVLDEELKALNITQQMFDSKLTEMKANAAALAGKVNDPAAMATRGETNDVVASAAAHLAEANRLASVMNDEQDTQQQLRDYFDSSDEEEDDEEDNNEE